MIALDLDAGAALADHVDQAGVLVQRLAQLVGIGDFEPGAVAHAAGLRREFAQRDSGGAERADQQLYRAKQEGRNRACLEMPPVSYVSAEEKGLLFGHSQFQDLE